MTAGCAPLLRPFADAKQLYDLCSPDKENLCLYGERAAAGGPIIGTGTL
jgi:hypothetical protein